MPDDLSQANIVAATPQNMRSTLPEEAAATPAPSSIPDAGKLEIPDALKSNKAFKDVLTGAIPGVVVAAGQYYPSAGPAVKHMEDVLKLGLDFYFAYDNSTALFNPAKITEQELQAADKAGKLNQVLPDYGVLTGEKPEAPPANGAANGAPAGSPSAPTLGAEAPAPTNQPGAAALNASVPPPDPKILSQLNMARIKNVTPGSPSSGPVPGSGRVLTGLLKPAI